LIAKAKSYWYSAPQLSRKLPSQRRSIRGGRPVVRVDIKGWFTTYKTLKTGERREYHYHRATLRRLSGKPASSEFIAAYAAAEKLIRDRLAGTFNGLVRTYTLSVEFEEKLAPSTQLEYRRLLTAAASEFGNMPLAALDDPGVRKDFLDWREKVARTSGEREADNRLSAISAMLTWAVDRGQANANYLRGFKRLYHADRSEIIWLPEHIESFMKVAPIEMQRALILALHTGQREGGLLRLPWSGYDGVRIGLRQGKTRRGSRLSPLVEIPCTAALCRMLDGMERVSPLILTTKTGHSLKKRYFARLWDEAMEKAGLQSVLLPGFDQPVELHFHDLRGTAVTLLSEAGCTPQQIATITGHSLKTVHRILERYLARTRGLAEQAIFNFENSPRTRFANQLQTVASPKTTKKGKYNA
jgi:integrase